jgi:hypothetical protein
MKNQSIRKTGIIAGLLGIILWTGCDNIVHAPEAREAPRQDSSDGVVSGTVRVEIRTAGEEQRTLLPSAPEFSYYTLTFQQAGQTALEPERVELGETYTGSLAVGDWTIRAAGYVYITGIAGITDGYYPAALNQEPKPLTVTEGGNHTVVIDIAGDARPGSNGIFSYNIGLPSDSLTAAELTIFPLTGGAALKTADLTGAGKNAGSFALGAGYYLLQIEMIATSGRQVKTEVIHIHGGLTTRAEGQAYRFMDFFNNLADLYTYLAALPFNNAANPYVVNLYGLNLETDFWNEDDPLGRLYGSLGGKYVVLDLSACPGNIPYSQTYVYRSHRDKVVSVILSDTLTSIGRCAFWDCSSLASIDLPDSLTSIGNSAFYNCSSLKSIDLPDTLTSIGEYAFYICSSLASVDLPDSLTSIGEHAFGLCSSLASVDLPDSLTSIGNVAFAGCSTLALIDLPDSLTHICSGALAGCSTLASIVLPDSLT